MDWTKLAVLGLIAIRTACVAYADGHEGDPGNAQILVEQYLHAARLDQPRDPQAAQTSPGTGHLFRSADETAVLRQIRERTLDERLEILDGIVEAANVHPAVVARVEDVTHAVVALNSETRRRVIEAVVRPRCEDGTPDGEQAAAVRAGVFLQVGDDIPGFAQIAVTRLLEPGPVEEREFQTGLGRNLLLLFQQFPSGPFADQFPYWNALLSDGRVDAAVLRQFDALLLDRLSRADPDHPVSEYGNLLTWFVDHRRVRYPPGAGNAASVDQAEKEQAVVAYLCSAISQNPDSGIACFKGELAALRMEQLATLYPVLLEHLPDKLCRELAVDEMETFLNTLAADATTEMANGEGMEASVKVQTRIPKLYLADSHLESGERRRLAEAILDRMKSCRDSKLRALLGALTHVAGTLSCTEVIGVFEMISPSPFDAEKKPLAVSEHSYRSFGEAVSAEIADEVARWLLEQIQTNEDSRRRYAAALSTVVEHCRPETVVSIAGSFIEQCPLAVSNDVWTAVLAVGKAVPPDEATVFAKKLVAAAQDEPEAAIAASKLRLAGALTGADSQVRYEAFEMILRKIDNPEGGRGSTYAGSPRGHLLAGAYSPAIQTVLSDLPPETRQKAFQAILDASPTVFATPESFVLAEGLIAMAQDMSADEATAAFEWLVRLAVGNPQQNQRTLNCVRAFLAKRTSEESPQLIGLLLPSIIRGNFDDKRRSTTTSGVLLVLEAAAQGLSSAGACEATRQMLELTEKYGTRSLIRLFEPFLRRAAPAEGELLAADLVARMRQAEGPNHKVLLGRCVARLGGASQESRAAAADTLIELVTRYVDEELNSKRDLRQKCPFRDVCVPLEELLPKLTEPWAAPRRDRLVKLLCRIVYKSDQLPEAPKLTKLRGTREELGNGVAELLGATKDELSPEMMRAVLYCAASLAIETHPASYEKTADALRRCPGTLPPGDGYRLVRACVGDLARSSSRERCTDLIAAKLAASDVAPVYQVAWSAYCQSRDCFTLCLKSLAQRFPAESAWSAIREVLREYRAESQEYRRRYLQELVVVLATRLPDSQRRQVEAIAGQEGVSLQAAPGKARSSRSPRQAKEQPMLSLEDLVNGEPQAHRLYSFLNQRAGLPLGDRLELVRQLDAKAILTLPMGQSLEPYVRRWFSRELPPDAAVSVVQELAEPDCVGLKQRLLTAALAAYHDREFQSDLWELADCFSAED